MLNWTVSHRELNATTKSHLYRIRQVTACTGSDRFFVYGGNSTLANCDSLMGALSVAQRHADSVVNTSGLKGYIY